MHLFFKTRKILTLFIILISACSSSAQTSLYISPDGDDNNNGSFEQPFKSLSHTKNVVRQELKNNREQNINVILKAGDYFIDETLIFSLYDSPGANGSVTWKSERKNAARIIGATKLSGWEKLSEGEMDEIHPNLRNRVYYAELPDVNGKWIHPRILFAEGLSLNRARGKGFVPGRNAFKDISEFRMTKGSERNDTLYFQNENIKNYSNLQDVDLIVRPSFGWVMNILPLKAVNTTKGIAITKIPATYQMRPLMFQRAFHYGDESCWVENIFEAMQKTGDWVSDSRTKKIYLLTDGNKPDFPVYAPALKEFIRLEGTDGKPIQNLSFQDIDFNYADRDTWVENDIGLQHDWEIYDKSNAVVRLKGAKNCVINGCRFRKCGNTAIRLDFFAQNNRIINNEISEMGGTGVLLCGYGPGNADVNRNNEVANNHIHHCGQQYWMNAAIHVWQSGNNRIANNKIHDMPYIGIVVSGVRPAFFMENNVKARELFGTVNREKTAYAVKQILSLVDNAEGKETLNFAESKEQIPQYKAMDILDKYIHTDNNIVEYNDIYDVMQVMADGDAIYLSATGRGNVIRGNYIHDVVTYGSLGHMIRNDGAQYWTQSEDNIIVNSSGGIALRDGCISRNNYIINITYPHNASKGNRAYSPFQVFSSDTVSAIEIHNNVIYFENSQIDQFYSLKSGESDVIWKNIKDSDNNIYWSGLNSERTVELLKSYQTEHQLEQNSLVENPGLNNPFKGDFLILKDTPLQKLGIKILDASKAGLLKEPIE